MINFPTSLDTLTNPTGTNQVAVIDHAEQHSNVNDIVEALEAKVGINGSAVTTSHDYKLGEVTGSDKAVGKSATQTLTNKTLTTPKIADTGSINDTDDNEFIKFSKTSSAVNELNITNSATGDAPILGVSGGDTNIDLSLKGKGTGNVKFGTANIKLPNADGTNGQVLVTDGSGNLSFTTVSSATANSILPTSVISLNGAGTSQSLATNTTMLVGLVNIPQNITVNKVTFKIEAYTSSGTLKIVLYTYNGSSIVLNATSATISSTGFKTITLGSPVSIASGQYYLGVVGVSGNFTIPTFTVDAGLDQFTNAVASGYVYEGTLTVTAGTPPSTIDPTAITKAQGRTANIRLDN